MTKFVEFPKMARWVREIIISEKIDGTNASIYIGEDGSFLTGSRTRWITPDDDNYGFSRWAHEHKEELMQLGPGHHFGEWWGQKIQRGYGLKEKRFSLFNTSRWAENRPECCDVVPILYQGMMSESVINLAIEILEKQGSVAAPGFSDPEGIVIFHVSANSGFKKTIKHDEIPKGLIRKK
jgi:hypothetical protein